jgi:hypothetical protein
MVASGILVYFNFVTPFTKVSKKFIKFYYLCQVFRDAGENELFQFPVKVDFVLKNKKPYPRLRIGLIS